MASACTMKKPAVGFSIDRILGLDTTAPPNRSVTTAPLVRRDGTSSVDAMQPNRFHPTALPRPSSRYLPPPILQRVPLRDSPPMAMSAFQPWSQGPMMTHRTIPGMGQRRQVEATSGAARERSFKDYNGAILYAPPSHHIGQDDLSADAGRKGGQVRFTHNQSIELERIFTVQKYISPQERKQMACLLKLSERQVKTWFQNRRAKWRRLKIEAEMRKRLSPDELADSHVGTDTDDSESRCSDTSSPRSSTD